MRGGVRSSSAGSKRTESKLCLLPVVVTGKAVAFQKDSSLRGEKENKTDMGTGTRRLSYDEYIKSDHWQELRSEKLNTAGRRCQCCFKDRRMLHVHHIRYRNYVDCILADLAVLCEKCHTDFHIASQYYNFNYIGVELPAIKEWVLKLRADNEQELSAQRAKVREEKRAARREKKLLRAERKAKQPPTVKPSKPKTRRQCLAAAFQEMYKKECSDSALRELIDSITSLLSNTEIAKHPYPPPANGERYEPQEITPELLRLMQSNGSFNRHQLTALGLSTNPPRGWRKALERAHYEREQKKAKP